MTQTEALDMITKIQLAHQAMEAACIRIDQLKAENKALKKSLAQPEQEPVAKAMTAHRAAYFMERFKHEEKLLGPNEQAALDFVISMLEAEPEQEPVVWMYQDKSTHQVSFQKHMKAFVDHSKTSEVPLYGKPLANHELQCVCGAVWCGDEMVHLPNKTPPQPKQDKERCVGCEACIDTACGRDECPKGWPKAAQPEQEPVGFYDAENKDLRREIPMGEDGDWWQPVYTTPPQRKPLTVEQIRECAWGLFPDSLQSVSVEYFARAIEAAHGIKE